MARTLTSTLIAAQKYGIIKPRYLIAKIRRRWGGIIRYDWVKLYSGTEYDSWHTAAMPNGVLIRLRVTSAEDSKKLYYQRIENPDENSDYSAWTYLTIYNVIAIASCAYGANIAQFYIESSLRKVFFRESTDAGLTWGAWTLIDYTPSTAVYGADAAYKPNGDICLIWNDQDFLYRKRRIAGSWENKADNPNPLTNITGVSIYYHEDWNIVVTAGAAGAIKSVSTCIYGDGTRQALATWSAWQEIISRGATEPYQYYAPFVRRPDTTRLFFVESLTIEELTNHIYYSHMPPTPHFDEVTWLEPVPTEPQSLYGLAFCQAGSYAWLTNANSVYRARATDDELDITTKLLIVDIRQNPDIRKGKAIITVNNTGGWYNIFPRLGQELTIGLGYKTAIGNEHSLTSSFWITKYKLVSPPWYILRAIYPKGIIGTLVIEAEDAWDFLKRYKTRRHYTWAAGQKSVKELLQYFIARSGLDFEVQSASDAATNFKPEFIVGKSISYRTIIKNLLKMIPDQLIFREAKVILRNPTTAEAHDWTYHNVLGTANLLYRGRWGTSGFDPNRAEVWGDTFMKEAANWLQIQMLRDRLSRVATPTYPTLTRAEERALAELRKSEIFTSEDSWMMAPTNCGLEPWDKVKITDTVGGVVNIFRRVLRMKTYYNKRWLHYHQTILLGAD